MSTFTFLSCYATAGSAKADDGVHYGSVPKSCPFTSQQLSKTSCDAKQLIVLKKKNATAAKQDLVFLSGSVHPAEHL